MGEVSIGSRRESTPECPAAVDDAKVGYAHAAQRRADSERSRRKDAALPKTWFITGTSSGFGRAMTERLLARGDRVAATLRQANALDDLRDQHGARLWTATLDVTDADAVRQTVARAFDDLGRIDVVVNNAGYGLFGAAEEVSDEQIWHQLDTNLVGSIQVIRAALPFLRNQGGGRILQVASEGGQIAYPNFGLYHASKWGVEGFVEAVSQEVAPFGIEFTIVEPGPTRTDFGRGLVSPAPMAVYDDTPVGEMRRVFASGDLRALGVFGDPVKMAQAMVDSADRNPAPKRLALGSRAYTSIRAALIERLSALDAQKEIAFSTDATD